MYRVLYISDGELCTSGSFESEAQAEAHFREQNGKKFDVRRQHVYMMYPSGEFFDLEEEDL